MVLMRSQPNSSTILSNDVKMSLSSEMSAAGSREIAEMPERWIRMAEGVEAREQLVALRTMGCDYGQGYLFAEPLTPAGAESLLDADPTW